ncbi:MAG: hypothetical protein INR70_26420, partial [Parafilimonas terrae]|nr:hypothetical protein [Parafilimonas terrae]
MTPDDHHGWLLHLIWASPFLLVVGLLAAGRVGSVGAGLVAAAGAGAVALTAAPLRLTPAALLYAAGEGAWLAFLVGTVILSGLFFRNVAAGGGGARGVDTESAARPR